MTHRRPMPAAGALVGPLVDRKDHRIALLQWHDLAARLHARALFDQTMASLVEMDLESHDRLIAYVLGLSHALNIAFFTALAESGEAAPKLATLSSTTFDAQLGVAAKIGEQNFLQSQAGEAPEPALDRCQGARAHQDRQRSVICRLPRPILRL